MDNGRRFSDPRLSAFCVYCGSTPNTRDHTPSKVLLDQPYPNNLGVVPCCGDCNQSLSIDEEYFACLVECAACGTVDLERILRPTIRQILRNKPRLHEALVQLFRQTHGDLEAALGADRCVKVVHKLACGHAAFQSSEPQLSPPTSTRITPFKRMSCEERIRFEEPPDDDYSCPEIGSHLMRRLVEEPASDSRWVVVQTGRYRYLTAYQGSSLVVRIGIGDHLGCEVAW